MKAVEIEFLMKDNLTAGLDKSREAVQQLLGKAKQAAFVIGRQMESQRQVIAGVNGDLARMERQLTGMKPGTAQKELAADIAACRKVLAEESGALSELEKQHDVARRGVALLEEEYRKAAAAEDQAAASAKTLKDKISEQKEVIRQVEADVKNLQKAYDKVAPGKSKESTAADLAAARRVLSEEKGQLTELITQQENYKQSTKRLNVQLRQLQDNMAKMRLSGQRNTEEYREMAAQAAKLRDAVRDLSVQTKILSDDDHNLRGFASGVYGLAGAFTTATGVMSLFASENEDLIKVQTRVQSVMAITMGLQQVFNALNKDSAFRLVTVAKMQNLLSAANTRLAAAFGISTAAANVLLGTLTLGLSVAITAAIVAWNKYSAAQEEAAQKAQQRVEIEADGRAQMIKTRFELDTTRESLKNFTGSKEEEKKKVDELNRKYGEAFGYYNSVAKWYEVLTQKAESYIQMLFLQAKAQALVNKAVEADEKVNKLKSQKPGDADSDIGILGKAKAWLYHVATLGALDAREVIKNKNQAAYDQKKKELEEERDSYLKEAEALEKQKAQLGKVAGLGGHAALGSKTGKTDTHKQQQHSNDELLALQRQNQRDEITLMKEGAEKKKAQIRQEYRERKAELDKQETSWKLAQKNKLTDEQKQELKTARENAEKIQNQAIAKVDADLYQEQINSMRAYLKEYGTMQQQRLAIAEEYADKIKKATTEGERKKLEKERDAATAQVSARQFAESVDWSAAFGSVGNVLKDVAKETLQQVEHFMKSAAFKQLGATDKKTYVDLRDKLRKEEAADAVSPFNFKIWGTIEQQVRKYQDSIKALRTAQEDHTAAVTELENANKSLEEATDEAAKAIAQKAVDIAQGKVDETAAKQTDAQNAADEAKNNLAESTNAAAQGIQNFTGYLNEMSNGSLYGFANGITKLVTSLMSGSNGVGKSLEQLSGKIGGIIGAILQILDALGDDPAEFIGGLLEKITNVIDTILDQLASGKLIESLVRGVFNLIGTVIEHMALDPINALTGGTLDFYKSNENEVKEVTERLTKSNEALQKSINNLKESIDKSGGMRAVGKYQEAYDAQKQMNENQRQILATQMNMHGKYHSNNYYWDREIDSQDYGRMNQALDIYHRNNPGAEFRHRRVAREEDVLELTPEQMRAIQTYASSTWTKMLDVGKYDKKEYWEKYVEMAGKLEELTDKINQNLTQVSFDSLRSDFVSSIMDMKKTAADFSEDFTEMMAKAWTNAAVSDLMQDDLNKFYKNWAAKMKAGQLSQSDIDALRSEYDGLVNRALRIRDDMSKVTGYTGSSATTQAGKAGGFTAMTQDQGNKLEGLFVSGQMHWASIDTRVEDVAGKMDVAQESLRKIEANTASSAKTLGEIKEDIKKIVRDGLSMK